jgi:hypothetical protein
VVRACHLVWASESVGSGVSDGDGAIGDSIGTITMPCSITVDISLAAELSITAATSITGELTGRAAEPTQDAALAANAAARTATSAKLRDHLRETVKLLAGTPHHAVRAASAPEHLVAMTMGENREAILPVDVRALAAVVLVAVALRTAVAGMVVVVVVTNISFLTQFST